jgi:hypothetical protein
MKKQFLLALVIASALIPSQGAFAQKLSSYNCKWQPSITKEHEEDLINEMQLDEKSQFLFLIANDGQKLYVDLMVADRAAIQKIMRYGLTTWINPEGKHKKALGIAFPVTAEGKSEPNFMRDKNGGGDRKEMRMAMMAAKNQEMDLIGFGEKGEDKVVDPRNDPDFHGKAEMMEGGKLYISLELTLSKLTINNPGEPFSLGFETGYMDVTSSGMSSGGGGQQPGGSGMYGGGGPGGGPPMGGSQGSMGGGADQQEKPDISQLASPSRLWIKQVILSPEQ